MPIRWVHLFLDTPFADAATAWAFWAEVTDSELTPARGERQQFATLVPAVGDPWLKLQAVASGGGGVHLDLDSDDPTGLAERAVALGATVIGTYHQVVLLRSPAGIVFCATSEAAGRQDRTGESLADQACLDIPPESFAAEIAFWSELTGWGAGPIRDDEEFVSLQRPAGIPVRILLQRLGAGSPAGAHLDIACRDRAQQVARHVSAGAKVLRTGRTWTVLGDPVGRQYCLTDRDPATGLLR